MDYKKVLTYIFIVVIASGAIFLFFSDSHDSPTTVTTVSVEKNSSPSVLKNNVTNNDSTEGFLYLVILFLSLAVLASISISFYLYKWRKILLSNEHMVMPEEWGKYLQKIGKSYESFGEVVGSSMKSVVGEINSNTEKITNMTETYMELHAVLDDKDKEIQRLKNGYDTEIFKRFISRFIRIEQTVDDFILEDEANESLDQLRRLFEDAFDECGVSKFKPEISEDYRNAAGVADNPKTEMTKDPEKEFLISEVLESGYGLNTGEGFKVIVPSKVRVFKLELSE